MSHQINVGAVALNQIPLDWKGNTARIKNAINMATDAGVSLLCLPELCITGYGCEDAFFSEYVQKKAEEIVSQLQYNTKEISFCVGLPLYHNRCLYNAVAFIHNGRVYYVPKQNLCADGVHYEPRWFKPWIAGEVDHEIGDHIIDCGGVRIGFEICEDAWVARRPGISLSERGVDIILNPSASHFAFGKHETRRNFVVEGSRAFRCGYIYANLLGNESGRIIFDGDTFIANCGKLIVEGPRFSFNDVVLTCAIIDVQTSRTAQTQNYSFKPSVENIKLTNEFKYNAPIPIKVIGSNDNEYNESSEDYSKYEEFSEAVSLGLFDYARKSHSKGFVVSLSGGADSSAVSVLVDYMYKIAVDELGEGGVIKKLGFDKSKLLTCIYQGSDNSSDDTLNSAKGLAESIGAKFISWNISSIIEAYERRVSDAIGKVLSWDEDDIARQNIQARVRSPGAWMIANINNALFLSTSNRSEAAVGYATADGDLSGGLSPIAGIDKNFLLNWLQYMKSTHYPGLSNVLKLKPTAELRPEDKHQDDESDLMPYKILDGIEKAAIRDKLSPKEIVELGFDKEHVKKFFQLWCRNQWKREKIAVSFHLDDENLDPKTWCRWPVLNSGLIEELESL